jgi:hypothetical protein
MNNWDRAEAAQAAINAFVAVSGPTDEEDVLKDLLADLMHWAVRYERDFDAALASAQGHFEYELEEEAA